MKVRLTADMGGVHTVGSVMDVPVETAQYLIEQGQAVAVDTVRSAEVAPPQNAAVRTTKPTPHKRQKG